MPPSLSGKAFDIIKSEIVTCALEPGQQIAQIELAERLGLGTTPVREALQRLAVEGFVHAIPRLGYIVAHITFNDVQEIFELRVVLESAAVRWAAQRGEDPKLEDLSAAADFYYVFKDRQSYSEFLTHNAEFHLAIAIMAGNQRLAAQVSRLLDELNRLFHLGLDLRDSAAEMREEHLALSRALRNRDAEGAEQLVRAQILRSEERVLEALTTRQDNSLSRAFRGSIQL